MRREVEAQEQEGRRLEQVVPALGDRHRPHDLLGLEVVALHPDTEAALRAFADDLNDVTGDLVAANLILAARRRNRSLAKVLQGVAESVAEDVASRRRVEAGRDKPRGSARIVTLFSVSVLAVLAFTGDYVAPYATPGGQVILLVLLAAYAGALLWMRTMAAGAPLPRILGPAARAGAR